LWICKRKCEALILKPKFKCLLSLYYFQMCFVCSLALMYVKAIFFNLVI